MSLKACRDALKVREGYWFAPKLFGFGATPVTWQGWLSLAIYIALVVTAARYMPGTTFKLALIIPLTLGFMWFVWTKTDGGWHWRWGPGGR